MTKVQKLTIVLLFSTFYFLISGSVWAAILYLEPASGEYHPGDALLVKVRIDTEGECINTVKVDLNFSSEILEAVDFSQGDSILTLWINPPSIDREAGLISFTGGIPAGFCGRIPGDPGMSNLLGKIIFRIPGMIVSETEKNLAEVKFLDTSKVLLNDGFGTPTKLIVKGATFTILAEPGISKDEWREELKRDKIPPEPFKIEISQNPAIFEGKYFVIFSTVDKQTGIDHYEIKEGEKDWEKAAIPYLLKDQSLENILKVKAVDKAGNERIVEYTPSLEKKSPLYLFYLYSVIVLILIGLIWWFIRRKIKK